MIAFFLGNIPMGGNPLIHPTRRSVDRQNNFAQYDVTRGKPVLHEIGEELDVQSIEFYFSEEFCNPANEILKLETAFKLKTPLPLITGNGVYFGKHYIVESLWQTILKTNKTGELVRVEAGIDLKEVSITSLSGLISSIAKTRASAIGIKALNDPDVRK